MRRAHASVGAFQSNVRGMSNVRKRCLELVREIDQFLAAMIAATIAATIPATMIADHSLIGL